MVFSSTMFLFLFLPLFLIFYFIVKDIKKMAEDSKVAIRAIRRDGIDKAKAMQKNSEITEDDLRSAEDTIQKLTDKKIDEIDKILADKEQEILKI